MLVLYSHFRLMFNFLASSHLAYFSCIFKEKYKSKKIITFIFGTRSLRLTNELRQNSQSVWYQVSVMLPRCFGMELSLLFIRLAQDMLWSLVDADWTSHWRKSMPPAMPCSLHQTHEGSHKTFPSGH